MPNAEERTKLFFKILSGDSQINKEAEILQGIEIPRDMPNIVIRIKSQNAVAGAPIVKEKLSEIMQMAQAMAPEGEPQKLLSLIQFDVAAQGEYIVIGICINYPVISQIIEKIAKIQQLYCGTYFSDSVEFEISHSTSFKKFLENMNDKPLNIFLNNCGVKAKLNVHICEQVMGKIRKIILKLIESKQEVYSKARMRKLVTGVATYIFLK